MAAPDPTRVTTTPQTQRLALTDAECEHMIYLLSHSLDLREVDNRG